MSCLSRATSPPALPAWTSIYQGVSQIDATLELRCLGLDSNLQRLSVNDWATTWAAPLPDGRSCAQLFTDLIHRNTQGPGYLYDTTRQARVQDDFRYMLQRYFNTGNDGFIMSEFGAPSYTPFQSTLITACTQIPGACSSIQPSMCGSCDRNQISSIADLTRLCGCYAPPLDAATYKTVIDNVCDPLCSQGAVAKLIDPSTGIVQRCNQSICVLDAISLQASESLVSAINFTQVCPGCTSENGCKCIVDTSVLNSVSELGITDYASFRQYCPAEFSTCLEINSITGTSVEVPCATSLQKATIVESKAPVYRIPIWLWVILGIMVGLVIYALLVYVESEYFPIVKVPQFHAFKNTMSSIKQSSRNF